MKLRSKQDLEWSSQMLIECPKIFNLNQLKLECNTVSNYAISFKALSNDFCSSLYFLFYFIKAQMENLFSNLVFLLSSISSMDSNLSLGSYSGAYYSSL